MKFSDYRRLGKISINTRIKSTRNTIRGISFGLILLIPIIFFVFSFYISLNKSIHENPTIASFIVETKHYTDTNQTTYYVEDLDNKIYINGGLAYDNMQKFASIPGVSDIVISEYYSVNFERSKISFDEIEYNYDRKDYFQDEVAMNDLVKIFHHDLSSGLFTKAEKYDFQQFTGQNQFFLYGSGFVGDGKGQVILSETLLRHFEIEDMDIIGQKFSFHMFSDRFTYIDNNSNPYDRFLPRDSLMLQGHWYDIIKDFLIVGVIKEDIYRMPSRVNEAHIWLSKSSLYDNYGKSYLPIINFFELLVEDKIAEFPVHTYSSPNIVSLIKEANGKKMVFMPIGFGAEFVTINEMVVSMTKPRIQAIIQFDNIKNAMKYENEIIEIYAEAFPISKLNYKNSIYSLYQTISDVGKYIIIFVLTFGGIIFLATLLNLYNTIAYSVKTRINYIGVMRAIGAKQSIIPKMFFYEIIIVLMRAFIYVITLAGVLSYLIKLRIEAIFANNSGNFPFLINMNFWFFPLTLVIIVIIQYLIGLMFSSIATRNVSYQPILEILKDEK